jgi:hypothetical protein
MRDLKRSNAKWPAYKFLAAKEFEVFTPTKWQLTTKAGKRTREKVPIIRDLLFVHSTREELDPVVEKNPTIQYCYQRGSYRNPMVVADGDMEQFVRAVNIADRPKYFLPGELTPDMYGRTVRITGGPMAGYEGRLLAQRGSRKKRFLVELPNLLSVGVEIEADFIEMVNEKTKD